MWCLTTGLRPSPATWTTFLTLNQRNGLASLAIRHTSTTNQMTMTNQREQTTTTLINISQEENEWEPVSSLQPTRHKNSTLKPRHLRPQLHQQQRPVPHQSQEAIRKWHAAKRDQQPARRPLLDLNLKNTNKSRLSQMSRNQSQRSIRGSIPCHPNWRLLILQRSHFHRIQRFIRGRYIRPRSAPWEGAQRFKSQTLNGPLQSDHQAQALVMKPLLCAVAPIDKALLRPYSRSTQRRSPTTAPMWPWRHSSLN